MNNNEQRIAIATACGWKFERTNKYIGDRTSITVTNPHGGGSDGCVGKFYESRDIVYFDFEDIFNNPNKFVGPVPDYLNDLNAMHNAEMSLTVDQKDDFQDNLWRVVAEKPEQVDGRKTIGDWRNYTHSTAAQRAEAFLKTLNLWVE